MKKVFRILARIILSTGGVLLLLFLFFHFYYSILNSVAKKKLTEVELLEQDGFQYRDLNKNRELDIYEDSRQSVEKRVDDLLGQMTLE